MNLRNLEFNLEDLSNVDFGTGTLIDGYVVSYDSASGKFQLKVARVLHILTLTFLVQILILKGVY